MLAFVLFAACATDATPIDEPRGPVALEVVVEWAGTGRVGTSDGAWSCSDHCTSTWDATSTLLLEPTPILSGAVFAGWAGDCGGTERCSLTLDQPRRVIARFVGGGAWPRTLAGQTGPAHINDIASAPDGTLVIVGTASGTGELARHADRRW